jgi:hypothetical protein
LPLRLLRLSGRNGLTKAEGTMTSKPQNDAESMRERIARMKAKMRAETLGEALDKGFYLRKIKGELWLCIGQWTLQKVEVQE